MLQIIFQTEETSKLSEEVDKFINMFGNDGAWFLIFAGMMMLIWFFYDGYRKGGFLRGKREDWELDQITSVLKSLIILGTLLGLMCIAVGIISIVLDIPPSYAYRDNVKDGYDKLTSISLIVIGMVLFFKVMSDVPWATILGFLAGAAVAFIVAVSIPDSWNEYLGTYVNMKWVIFWVFLIVSALVTALVRFWLAGIEILSKIISWAPVSLAVAIYCFIQGFGLLIWGHTLYLF